MEMKPRKINRNKNGIKEDVVRKSKRIQKSHDEIRTKILKKKCH